MLRVSLLGNLGADPEVRYTQKGTQQVTFNVAVNQVRFGKDGDRQENTEWFRVRVLGRQSEFAQRLSKGSRVLVIGRLDISHYQAKDGESRTAFDVWADDVQSMTPRAMLSEPDGMDAEGDALEPALAGVSSLNGAAAGRGANASSSGSTNGSAQRARPPRAAGPSSGGNPAEDLEDLPF